MAERMRRGSFAWLLLAAVILAWDLAARDGETLSECFRRACTCPRGKVAVRSGWLLLTAHLFGVLPRSVDPLHAVHAARSRARGRKGR